MTYVPKIGDVAIAKDLGVRFDCYIVAREKMPPPGSHLYVVDVIDEEARRRLGTHRAPDSTDREVIDHFETSASAYYLMADDFVCLRICSKRTLRRRSSRQRDRRKKRRQEEGASP